MKLFETSEHRIAGSELELLLHNAVRRVASDAVMKVGFIPESEPATMRLVRDTTTILVPRVLRFFRFGANQVIVMDYIPGRSLEDCWETLGWWQRCRVIWTIRRYIRQLRRVSVPGIPRENQFPGPIGNEPSKCEGTLFTIYVSRSVSSSYCFRIHQPDRVRVHLRPTTS